MRALRLLLPLLAVTSPLAAQKAAPRVEIGVDASYWQLDRGTATVGATSRPSGTVRAAVLIPSRLPASLGFSATYAGEDGIEPGLLAFGSEFAQRLFPANPDGLNLFVSAGAGILRFYSEEQRRIIDACTPEEGCMYEGYSYNGEWRPMMTASLGADLGMARWMIIQPTFAVVKPFGQRDGSGGNEAMFRLGVGLALRP